MTNSSTNIQEILESARKDIWNIFEPDNSWKDDQTKCTDIQQRLSYFNFKQIHSDSPDHIDKVIKALTRGVALTQAAINWHNPAIGQNPKRTKIDKLRGIQWRLIIAYSGFEITTKALMNHFKPTTPPEVISEFIKRCNLPNYQLLASPNTSPNTKPNLEKWLSKEQGAIISFLGVRRGDANMIKHWIVNSHCISSWEDAVKLAKALRNASAHGYLLPKKVADWELKPGLLKLADNLAEIMAAGLKKLT